MTDKVLGHATAYGYYKAGGGTMTEAEFTEFMADFGTASQTAVEAAQAALASETASRTAATTATNKATEATTAATTATTKAGEASTSASTATSAKDTAVSASQTATTKATEATTAAATATSAKTDAVAANTAAQSAKTAAQTAQTGAETAAASVEASSAQIATNAEDISQLKSDLTDFSKLATGYNLIDPSTIVDGEFWNGSTTSSGNYSRTPLIAVKPNTAYTFANTEANYWDTSKTRARTIVYFKSDGTYISPWTENTGNFTTPENCAFVGISFLQNARNVILIEGTYDITAQTMMYIPYVSPDRQVNGDDINGLSIGSVIDYGKIGKNLFDKSKAIPGLLNQAPSISANDISFISDYIPVKANVSYVISNAFVYGSRNYSIRSYLLYDIKHQKVSGESGDVKTKVVTPTVDGYLRFCGYNEQKDWTQVEVGSTPTAFEPYKIVLNDEALLNEQQIEQVGNILYRKKWAVCGDSFTAGSESTLLTEGRYIGRPVTYPWIIGNRNDMDILKFFDGGRTLAFPANPSTFTNSLTNPNASFYYQNIPADVDYITIYLGINDEHHAPNSSGGDGENNTGEIPIGTVDDNTVNTYLGAWNVVLTWLITNRPNAHIGIIVTNGNQSKDEYRLGQIAIAEKYGIPYIDMNGDARTPAMLRTSNPNIPSAIKQALIQKWAVDPSSNTHPNDAAHLFESRFIENFLRSI